MPDKPASELRPGDRICTKQPIGRATIVDIRQTKTEIRSRKGEYGDALMIIYTVDGTDYRRRAADYDFIHINDRCQIP